MRPPWPLPNGWHWAEWKSIARVASNLVDPAEHQTLPHIAPNHIESWSGKLLPYQTVAEDKVISSKHLFSAGQILYSKIRPYLAKAVIVDFSGLCSADMYPVDTELVPRYLKWWMLSPDFTRFAAGEQARTVLPKINKHALGQLPVPVPPVEEQRRIVDLLEDHLSRLDAADAYLDTARRREAVLHDQLLTNMLFSAPGEEVPLRDVLTAGLSNGRSVTTQDGGFPVLRLTALRDGRIDLAERKAGAWSAEEAARFLVEKGDFLISRGNGSLRLVGRGGLVVDQPDPVAYPDTLIRARPAADKIMPDYLALVWNAPEARRQIEKVAKTTAGIYKVNQKDLGAILVPLPSLADQRRIVESVAESREALSRLSGHIRAASDRSDSLRRSLLAAAFSGRLTGDREPAGV